MQRAMGITIHTGWGACVIVGGSLEHPEIIANVVIEVLGKEERFCFHAAAEMKPAAGREWIGQMREKALVAARKELARLTPGRAGVCAIVAKEGDPGDLAEVLASHPRMHTAEGCLYRDVFRDACPFPSRIVPPSSLSVSSVPKLAAPPWGRDQKLAALAAWSLIGK
jgi:hypothetical protein